MYDQPQRYNEYLTNLVSNECKYMKIYIGHFSVVTQKRIRLFINKRYCNDLDIELVFSSFKIGNMFGVKDRPWRAPFACSV